MMTFYQRSPSRQSIQRKPDELSFLSDDEDQEEIGFKHKIRRDSNLTNTDSAYFSENSNHTSNVMNKEEIINSPNQVSNRHQNVIIWQKQQQHYQQQNPNQNKNSMSPLSRVPTLDSSDLSEPGNDYWDVISDNGSIRSTSTINNKLKYSTAMDDFKSNNPEQRAERIHLRMNQWKRKLEQMNNKMTFNNNGNGGITQFNRRNSMNRSRSVSISNSVHSEPPPEPFKSSQSVYSISSSFDEKYDSFFKDDNSNFNQNNKVLPSIPRPSSALDFRHNQSSFSNPFQKESKIQALQQELENNKYIYNQKIQQLNQMKMDLEQYQFKMEEVREMEIENARQQAIEELEQTTIKNLKIEIDALQLKLEETVKELEHSKTYADMLRNEVLILKMNEQNLSFENIKDEEFGGDNEIASSESVNELTLMESPVDQENLKKEIKEKTLINEENEEKVKSLENIVKQKDNEIQELKKQLERVSRSAELSKKEIVLLNKKVLNHKQAREDIEQRHTKLVDIASANEIELNKLRYKMEKLNQNKNSRTSSSFTQNNDITQNTKSKMSQINKIKNDNMSNTNNNIINKNKNNIQTSNLNNFDDKQKNINSSKQNNDEIINEIDNNSNVLNIIDDNTSQDDNNSEIDEDINNILNELSLSDYEFDKENEIDFKIDEILNSEEIDLSDDISILSD